MNGALTPEQKRKIEENRRIALEKRAARVGGSSCTSSLPNKNNSESNPRKENKTYSHLKNVFKSRYRKSFSTKENPPKEPDFRENLSNRGPKGFYSNPWTLSTEKLKAHLHLVETNRFSVQVPYDNKIIEFLKSIPGREYDNERREWSFPIEKYHYFKEKAISLESVCFFSNLPSAVLRIFGQKKEESIKDENKIDLSHIEAGLLDTLFPFQKEGVKFGISKNGRCIIADDMGLGKTLQALAIAHYYKQEWPLLIICPSSMRFQWEEEIHKNLPSVPSFRTFAVVNKKEPIENASVVIVSYDLMSRMKEVLKSINFGVIILDESHYLKNGKTIRTKAALELAAMAKRCILLSGTPALSRPAELYTQIKAVSPSLFKDMIEFGIRYCEGKHDKFGWNFSGSSNLQELKLILEDQILIRRLKSDVLHQLPSKMRYVIVLNSENVDTKTKEMNAFAKKLDRNQMKGSERRSALLAYFSESGKAKIKAVCEHIEKLLEQNKKFLCFGHHKEVLNAICELLEEKQTFYIKVDGSMSSEDRKSVCDQFQEEDKFRVAVLSIKAANTGLTLTAAQLVIFAELFWNPGDLLQAEDRAHRIGQNDSVMVQYLIAKGTADDYLWPLVQSKLNILNKAGLSKDNEMSTSTELGKTKENQKSSITDYFSALMNDEDDIDESLLNELLDEIDGVPEKKQKIE